MKLPVSHAVWTLMVYVQRVAVAVEGVAVWLNVTENRDVVELWRLLFSLSRSPYHT